MEHQNASINNDSDAPMGSVAQATTGLVPPYGSVGTPRPVPTDPSLDPSFAILHDAKASYLAMEWLRGKRVRGKWRARGRDLIDKEFLNRYGYLPYRKEYIGSYVWIAGPIPECLPERQEESKSD